MVVSEAGIDLRVPGVADSTEARARLADWICAQAGAERVLIEQMSRLSGGAIQENWALTVDLQGGSHAGRRQWVLRTDAPSAVALSLTRAQEFAVLSVADRAGVKVPRPLWLCREPAVIGRDFFLMERIAGVAAGHRLTRDADLVPDPPALAAELGACLARLHQIKPPHAELDFLPPPAPDHALTAIAGYRAYLDTLPEARPVMEWGLRWCEINAPQPSAPALIHRDYRTGNYMVDGGRLTGVLDWEFTAWGDPLEDLGWFTARCWRFARPDREAGGVGPAADFLRGYQSVSGQAVEPGHLRYWQVMAHVRWAVIALQQGERHWSGRQRSLELALTGRLVPELELEILQLIDPAGKGDAHG
jgi:aminoglycoside phosphotransferase (APT) family kinase protein